MRQIEHHERSVTTEGSRLHTLTFDNDCGFCTTAAHWVERNSHSIKIVSLQEFDAQVYGIPREKFENAAYFFHANGRIWRGSDAIGRSLLEATFPLRLLGLPFLIPPFSWIGRAFYPLVMRYRHLLPGATAACEIPRKSKELQ